MIAHAGLIFISLALKPRNAPVMPSSLMMALRTCGVLPFPSSALRALPTPLSSTPTDEYTCRLVFTTSNGVVTAAAIMPAVAPATKARVGETTGCSEGKALIART